MNIIKKIYCRVFQLAFRVAIPFLPYREPEKYSKISDVTQILEKISAKSVLLVTDSVLYESGITKGLEAVLKENKIHFSVFYDICPNPTVQNVEDALSVYKNNNCDAIIAFGGGSSIDCAKVVGARVVYPNKTVNKLKGLLRVLKKIPPLIAIPTTAGTGSEVTVTAVITDDIKKHKYTMNNFTFIPSFAILDPEVTYTLPPALTATTGMDALTHAVEAYIGRSTTKQTRYLAIKAVEIIFGNIEAAYKNGSDTEARSNMLNAAYMAGVAFSKSYVGYIHSVAHSLGGQYNIPHGLANSVLMPIVLEEYGECVYKKLHRLATAAGVAYENDTDKVGAEKFIQAVKSLNESMNIPKTLKGIEKQDIPKMARHADKEANPLYPVPKLMSAKQLEQFYYKVADWSK